MLVFLIKFNVTIALGYLLYRAIFQHGTTLQAKRYYFIALILFAAAMPLLPGLSMEPSDAGFYSVLNTFTTINSINTNQVMDRIDGIAPISVIYILGVVFMCISVIIKFIQLVILIIKSKIVNAQQYKLVTHDTIKTPASFFNLIFMPSTLNDKAYTLILDHEKLHAREWHSLDVLLLELMKVLCWFNPFIYLILRELRFVHECIADKAAGQSEKTIYQELLVQFHLSTSINNLTNHFNNSSNLKRRIIMFNATFSNNANIKKVALIWPFFLLMGVLQTIAQTTSPVAQQTEIDKMPEFKGGQTALISFLVENIVYPYAARTAGVEGTAFVEFIVGKNGKVKSATIKKSASAVLDAEALRVVNAMPKWIPGEQDGKKVDVIYMLPIKFSLN